MLNWIANPLYDTQVVAEYEIKITNSRALLARLMLFNLAGSMLFSAMYWFFDPYSDVYLYLFAAAIIYFLGYALTPFVSVKTNVYCFLTTFTIIQNLINFFILPLETMNYLFILSAPSGLLLFTDVISKWQRMAITLFTLIMVLLLFIAGNEHPLITLTETENSIASITVVIVFFVSSIATYDLYVQKMKVLQGLLVDLANKDELTGLYNRRALFHYGADKLRELQAERQKSVALMIDIDHFKRINDVYGHAVGDKVIRSISGYLGELYIEDAICGRYGGEEFAMFIPDATMEDGVKLAERIRHAVEKMTFSDQDDDGFNFVTAATLAERQFENPLADLKVTVSIGVSEQESRAETLDTLLDKADKALYQAKNTGRNKVETFTFKY